MKPWTPQPGDRVRPAQGVLEFRQALVLAPRARATDPETSREAAAVVDGRSVADAVLGWLRGRGAQGGTTHEIAEGLGMDLVTVSPRMKPMEELGFVQRVKDPGGNLVKRAGAGQRVASTVWRVVEQTAGGN